MWKERHRYNHGGGIITGIDHLSGRLDEEVTLSRV
jgi:hypothetical protein